MASGYELMGSMLLGAVVVAFVVAAIGSLVALIFFPWFRSGERKEGHFRADQSAGTYHLDSLRASRKMRAALVTSTELPLVGGPAMMLAIVVASIGAGIFFKLSLSQWELLGILLLAMLGYGAVGFLDDWHKVHHDEGISEIRKGTGVMLVSLLAAVALNRLIVSTNFTARLAYPPYSDIPFLGHILRDTHFAWIVFFVILTVIVASSTSLAVDFSDGMDGLCGGLLVSASLSLATTVFMLDDKGLWPAAIAAVAIAGAAGGFLPFNWPSSWTGRSQSQAAATPNLLRG